MKIAKKVSVVVVVVLAIIGGFFLIGFQKNMSANQSHRFFSRLITKELGGNMTQSMVDEGDLVLKKVALEIDSDREPRLYESKQPSKVFMTWYIVSKFEAKGQGEKVADLRKDLNEFIAKN
jgi:hypothetical protein